MKRSATTSLRIPTLLVGVLLAGCSLATDSGGGLGFDEPPPGIAPPDDGSGAGDGEGDTDGGETDPDDTSDAVDDPEPGTGDDGGGTGGGGGGMTGSGDDTDDGGTQDTGGGGITGTDAGTTEGAAAQPSSGMYSHCLSVNDCDAGFGCLTNDTATDGFCSILCEPVGDPAGCEPDPSGVLDPVCTVAGGGESVCALDCSGGQSCPTGMVCTADSLICM
jgi:hypothetical protein